jgi:hypothetical protein
MKLFYPDMEYVAEVGQRNFLLGSVSTTAIPD